VCVFQGFLHQRGADGVGQSDAIAAIWYQRAVELGHAGAALNLALLKDVGADGVARDPKQARHWLRKAAVLGSNDARRVLTQQAKKERQHAARSEAATAGIPEAEADLDRE